VHPWWWIYGPIVRYPNWQPTYPDEVATRRISPEPTYTVEQLLGFLGPEEKALLRAPDSTVKDRAGEDRQAPFRDASTPYWQA